MTTHAAMVTLDGAIQEYRLAEDCEVAARHALAGTHANDSNATLLPHIQAVESAQAAQVGASAAVCAAHRAAFYAYAENGPPGAALLLLRLMGVDMDAVDAPAIESAINAVFTPPAATA